MEISEYKNIYINEDTHFFYVSIHNLVLSFLKDYLPIRKNLKILDAGCGTGLLAKKLKLFGNVNAIDVSTEAIKFSRQRDLNVKKASVTKIPFHNNTFDLVTSIDVIYHKEVVTDQKALNEFFRVLKPEGILILRVPANQWLKLAHDELVHTKRRYNKKELEKKLIKANFKIEKISYINLSIFPFIVIKNTLEKLLPPKQIASSINPLPEFINKVLIKVLLLENYLIKKINLPFGVGLIAVCRKPH